MTTETTPEPSYEILWSVAQAATYIKTPEPMDRTTLAQLGKDCSLVARIWGRPTSTVATPDKPWPSEKTYTRDVILEAFRRHPATRDYVPSNQEQGS